MLKKLFEFTVLPKNPVANTMWFVKLSREHIQLTNRSVCQWNETLPEINYVVIYLNIVVVHNLVLSPPYLSLFIPYLQDCPRLFQLHSAPSQYYRNMLTQQIQKAP